MEIQKIDICNLNSLKGTFCIDFMSGSLKGQDIFAITGPTGSGKSTILDAITLALYNRVPRLDGKKGKENDSKSNDPYERLAPEDTKNTLTRGEKKGYAKVVFEASGERYRAEWICELKEKNIVGSHSLYRLQSEDGTEKAELMVTGNLIKEFDASGAPKDKSVSKEVVALIGLGYDQFCKACILAQNSFANFLKADDAEKADILEKITGTSIYGRIADVIVQGYDDAVRERNAIEDQIGGQRQMMLSDDDLAQATAERDGLRQEQGRLTREIDALEKGLAWWKTLGDLERELSEAEKKKKAAVDKEQELRSGHEKLERHDKVGEGLKRLAAETTAQKELETAEKDVAEAEKRLADNRDEIGRQEQQKVEAENDLETRKAERERLAWAKPIKENIAYIRSEYRMLNHTVASLRTAASRHAPESGYDRQDEGRLVKAAVLLTEDLDKDLTVDTMSTRLQRIGRELDLCDTALALYPQIDKVGELDAADQKDKETILAYEKPLEELGKEIDRLSSLIGSLENEDLAYKRSQLQEGQACPLCGAEHHPYTAEAVFNEVIEREKARLDGKTKEREAAERKTGDARDAINKRMGERKILTIDIDGLKRKMEAADPRWKDIFSKYKSEEVVKELKAKAEEAPLRVREKAEAEHTLSLTELRDRLQEVNTHRKALNEYLPEGWYEKRIVDRDEYLRSLETASTQYDLAEKAVSDADEIVRKITAAIETLKKLTPGLENDREAKKEDLVRKKEALQEHEAQLTAWIETFNAGDETPISREELVAQKEDKTDWIRLRKEINDAENDRIRFATLFGHAEEALQEHREKEDRPTEEREKLQERKAGATFSLKESENGVEARLTAVSGRLATHDAAVKAIADVQQELAAAKKKVDLWTRFYNMLGKNRGDRSAKEFRKLAQNYTLGLLLSYANEELVKFTRRYTLKKQNDSSLEIMVLDGELGERYASSLSGGETFMVSLALALGLSSISSGSVTLKNIFIDEGFGSLDSDLQKAVVGALNTLRMQGKRIGLISHTEALLGDDGIYKIKVEKVDEKFSRIVPD